MGGWLHDARSSRSPLRDHNVVTRTCCPLAPHCDKFAKKYGRKDEKKQLEYRYLFAAHHHCLRCMQYYCDQEDVNPHCKSENKNARDWAELYNKIIPRALEVWLSVAGASRTAALIYARMLNTLQLVVGKGSGETLSSR